MNSLSRDVAAESLGSADFRAEFNLRYAYYAGAMYKGIASVRLVVAMAKNNLLAFFGSGGLKIAEIEAAIIEIKRCLDDDQTFGMNLLCNLDMPQREEEVVRLYIHHGVTLVEASAFPHITRSLVLYRLKGLRQSSDGLLHAPHRIIAKISRPEVAEAFMRPAPEHIINKLLSDGAISKEEAHLGKMLPMANHVCVESDSGGHTDQGRALILIPTVLRLRNRIMREMAYARSICVGAAGGIGTPEAAAAAFVLGAEFVVTGSINQCTVEANTSDAVKDILQDIHIQDTAYAPAGDMFEIGAKVQVVKKGLLFSNRANKLYELYSQHRSLDEIELSVRQQLESRFFKRSFASVWAETAAYLDQMIPGASEVVAQNPKAKMAQVFRWYFVHSSRLALAGDAASKVDFQIHCGPAMGAFNDWVRGTPLESWKERNVAAIARLLMEHAASFLDSRFLHGSAKAFSTESRVESEFETGTSNRLLHGMSSRRESPAGFPALSITGR